MYCGWQGNLNDPRNLIFFSSKWLFGHYLMSERYLDVFKMIRFQKIYSLLLRFVPFTMKTHKVCSPAHPIENELHVLCATNVKNSIMRTIMSENGGHHEG